jgi:hypothetical protein
MNKRDLTEEERLAYIAHFVKKGNGKSQLLSEDIKKLESNKDESI